VTKCKAEPIVTGLGIAIEAARTATAQIQ